MTKEYTTNDDNMLNKDNDKDLYLLINMITDEPPCFNFSSRDMKNLFSYSFNRKPVNSDLVHRYLEMCLNRMELLHIENCVIDLKYHLYSQQRYLCKNLVNSPIHAKLVRLQYICGKLGITPNDPALPFYESDNKTISPAFTKNDSINILHDYTVPLRALLIACGKLPQSQNDKKINKDAKNIRESISIDDINYMLDECVVASSSYNISSSSKKVVGTYDWYSHWFKCVVDNHTTGDEYEKFNSMFEALTSGNRLHVMDYLDKFYSAR